MSIFDRLLGYHSTLEKRIDHILPRKYSPRETLTAPSANLTGDEVAKENTVLTRTYALADRKQVTDQDILDAIAQDLELATQQYPEEWFYWYRLSQCSLARKDMINALSASLKALGLRPVDPRSLIDSGNLCEVIGSCVQLSEHAQVAGSSIVPVPSPARVDPSYFECSVAAARAVNMTWESLIGRAMGCFQSAENHSTESRGREYAKTRIRNLWRKYPAQCEAHMKVQVTTALEQLGVESWRELADLQRTRDS